MGHSLLKVYCPPYHCGEERKLATILTRMSQSNEAASPRRWPRYKIDARLKVFVSDENAAFGRASNLSYGGMGAYIPCAIPVGTKIIVEVNFAQMPEDVKLKAVVRNADGFRYGLEFVEIAPDVRSLITKNCVGPAT